MTATRAAEASAVRANGPAYAAFISYSRDADGRLAPRLEYALERFATPWYRLRAFRVFRDDASLSTNPGLWSSLTGALDHVGYCILLASPDAAGSVWVGREVEYWLEHRGVERLLIVLTGGEIVWDEHTGDFDWERTTALPRTISGAYSEEPRYTDLRFAAHTDHVSVRDPRFRAAVADIAAPLHGIAKDDLIGEEVRQHKRTMRIARAAGISLALVTVAACVAAFLAVGSARDARRESKRAESAARVATSRQLAAQSAVALQGDDTDTALDQAARAWRTSHTTEARDAVLAALKGAHGLQATFQGPPRPDLVAFSGDGGRVAMLGADHRVSLLDLGTGETVGEPVELPRAGSLTGIGLDGRGERLAVGYASGAVDLWDLSRARSRAIAAPLPRSRRTVPWSGAPVGAAPVLSADGTRMAWGGPDREIFVWDGGSVRHLTAPKPVGDVGWDVVLSGDGRFLAAAGAAAFDTLLWDLAHPGPPRVLPGGGPRFATATLGAHGPIALPAGGRPVLAVTGVDYGFVALYDAASGRHLRTIKLGRRGIESVAFSPRGRILAVVDGRALRVSGLDGARIATFPAAGSELGAMALDEQGRTAAVGDSGRITIRDPAGAESQFAGRLEGTDTMTPLAFDRTGGHVAAVDPGGRVRVWNASGGQPEGGAVTGPVSPGVVRFLPDGRVVTCCSLGTGPARVRVWDRSGRERGTPPRVPGVTDVAVTPGGQLVTASGRGDQVTISGVGQPLHFRSDLLPTLSPDGLWASVSAKDGEEIWDLRRRHKTATLRDSVQAFSPAGPLVAVGSGPVVLYDRQTGRKRGSIGDADMELDSLAFSPDGRTLATLDTAGDQARLDLWDVERRRRLSEVPPFEGAVTFGELAFAPDGKKLALGTGEGAPLVFDLDADHWAARACELSPTCSGRPGQAGR